MNLYYLFLGQKNTILNLLKRPNIISDAGYEMENILVGIISGKRRIGRLEVCTICTRVEGKINFVVTEVSSIEVAKLSSDNHSKKKTNNLILSFCLLFIYVKQLLAPNQS